MEIYTDRVVFRKVLNKLELLSSTLELALNFGGVDANSLNRMKEAAKELCDLDYASFINEWLEEEDARGYLQTYIKKVWQMHYLENTKHKPERLGEDYVQLADTYDRVRNTIIWELSKQLKDDERVDEKGNIYKVNTEEINDEFGHTYRIGKPIEEPPKETPKEKTKKTFRDCILIDDKDGILKVLHRLIDGKIGKFVAEVLYWSNDNGLITIPSYNIIKSEFGNIGDSSTFYKYKKDGFDWSKELDAYRAIDSNLSKFTN